MNNLNRNDMKPKNDKIDLPLTSISGLVNKSFTISIFSLSIALNNGDLLN